MRLSYHTDRLSRDQKGVSYYEVFQFLCLNLEAPKAPKGPKVPKVPKGPNPEDPGTSEKRGTPIQYSK